MTELELFSPYSTWRPDNREFACCAAFFNRDMSHDIANRLSSGGGMAHTFLPESWISRDLQEKFPEEEKGEPRWTVITD